VFADKAELIFNGNMILLVQYIRRTLLSRESYIHYIHTWVHLLELGDTDHKTEKTRGTQKDWRPDIGRLQSTDTNAVFVTVAINIAGITVDATAAAADVVLTHPPLSRSNPRAPTVSMSVPTRGVHDTGIPMSPMGIPWEWEA